MTKQKGEKLKKKVSIATDVMSVVGAGGAGVCIEMIVASICLPIAAGSLFLTGATVIGAACLGTALGDKLTEDNEYFKDEANAIIDWKVRRDEWRKQRKAEREALK